MAHGKLDGAIRNYGPAFIGNMPVRQLVIRIALIMLMAALAPSLHSATHEGGRAVVIVDAPVKEFQEIMTGELITETFIITNGGDSQLRFKGVEMSHPGMKIRIKQAVEPGHKIKATVEWDTEGIAGDMRGIAVLLTNDPLQPRVNLALEGKIIPPIQILPRPVFYLSQFHGEHSTTEFIIQNNQEKPIGIERLELLGSHFKAEVKPKEEGRQWKLVVGVPAETPVGRYSEALKIHTDDTEREPVYVGVNVLVKPDVFINPGSIDFGSISLSRIRANPGMLDFITQTIVINRRRGTMAIKDIQNPLPFIEVEVVPDGPSNAFQLSARLNDPLTETGRFAAEITLITDDSEHSEIHIPVTGEISE